MPMTRPTRSPAPAATVAGTLALATTSQPFTARQRCRSNIAPRLGTCEQSEQTSKAIAGDFARLLAERWPGGRAFARLLARAGDKGQGLR